MDQSLNVLLAIDKVHTVLERHLDHRGFYTWCKGSVSVYITPLIQLANCRSPYALDC